MAKLKILAIKFKYLGDVAIAVPAVRALREAYPDAELHWLVAEDALPIIEHIPWVDKKWGFPKSKNSKVGKRLDILKALRREKFDISVDFVGNDRGAITSIAVGAKKRLGLHSPKGFLGRKFCYTHRMKETPESTHESLRDIALLGKIDVGFPKNVEPELHTDVALVSYAQEVLPKDAIICHLSTTRPKKEWATERWVKLYSDNPDLHSRFVFTTGPSEREQILLQTLIAKIPNAQHIKKIPSIGHFMAVIKEASGIICSDSLPSHLAGGLGTPCVSLFGPTTVSQWEPRGCSKVIAAKPCFCLGSSPVCLKETHCLSSIDPKEVIQTLMELQKEKVVH